MFDLDLPLVADVEAARDSPLSIKGQVYASQHLLVQVVAYHLSRTVFNYSSESFKLDLALRGWAASNRENYSGNIPHVLTLQSRAGAGAAMLGYLGRVAGPTSVLLSAGDLDLMLPILLQNREALRKRNIVFHVAAVKYSVEQAQLVNDYDSVIRVASLLGWPVVTSGVNTSSDVQQTAILASQISRIGPTVHVYDGLRGTRQVSVVDVIDAKHYASLALPHSVDHAFDIVNKALGTTLAPVEYNGPKDASTVYVSYGSVPNGATVRLANSNILHAIPAPTTKIIAGTRALHQLVSVSVNLKYGLGRGPHVEYRESPDTPAEEAITGIFFDISRSNTSAAPVSLARFSQADLYTVHDGHAAGGAVEANLRLGQQRPYSVKESNFVFVGNHSLVKSYDVVGRTAEKGNLVLVGNTEALDKLPATVKRKAADKQLNVFSVDFSKLDSQNTQGRTQSMATQAAFWHLTHDLTLDQITTKVVQANGQDTELVAATVNNLVSTLLDVALVRADTKDWPSATEEKELPELPMYATTTSFANADLSVEQDVGIETLTSTELAQRFTFKEAFGQKNELHPELAAQNYIGKVKVNQRVTPADYDRHIFHFELDITGTGLKYSIGEALGVHAPNPSAEVEEFLEWYGVDTREIVGVPHRDSTVDYEYKTAIQAFRDNIDLFGKVPKRFFEALAEYATDEKHRSELHRLTTPAAAQELKRRSEEDFDTYVDILREFNSAHPPIQSLVEMIAPLKRREYSIASSQKVHPNAVHLLVVVVDWEHKGKKRFGQCSKFLSSLNAGDEVVVSVKPSVMRLPKDPKTPIIMAGLGTGLAPFKAFLEEKMWQRDQGLEIGDVYLFLGSRHQRQEYLYGEEFEAYKAAGVLTHIGAAFSRDQPQKIYIQHRILESKEDLTYAFVTKNGNFYLCGPTWPVPDISAALSDIVIAGNEAKGVKTDTSRLIEDLKDTERYILEVY